MTSALQPRSRVEAPRDQRDSAFSHILRTAWEASPPVLALVFIDLDGECIDYCSALPPFDAKVAGAHLRGTWQVLQEQMHRLRHGGLESVLIEGSRRDLFIRRVNEDCTLVVVADAASASSTFFDTIGDTVRALRVEAAMDRDVFSAWPVHVDTRGAVGWPYAPGSMREGGRAIAIDAVLGRWVELGPGTERTVVCFRVRTSDGVELTLEHDAAEDRWARRV